VFILGRTFTIPSLIVGITELTQEEYEMYGKYGKTDNNMPPNSNYDTGSENPVYPAYGISFYDMIIFCNLRSMADGLTPVYALGGETDPKKWNGISKDSATGKYCGPSEINSSWDAVSFDTSANGWRLPTEAEWEYLARGANLTNISFTYSGSNSASDVGWFSGENGNKPTAVKQKTANLLGLYDMSGNVFELCWDWEGTIDTSTPITGVASGTRRMVRGGGCTYGADPYGKVGDRHVSNTPVMRWANCGARLVRNAN
jgi:formylglycine-generating enzyme required for sulfatase activity